MSFDPNPAVTQQYLTGSFERVQFIRFEIPGNFIGFHQGNIDFPIDGFTYHGNRSLDFGELQETLEDDIEEMTVTFSNTPFSVSDVLFNLESLPYTNAPVTIFRMVRDPDTKEQRGFEQPLFMQIFSVAYEDGAEQDGIKTTDINITLRSRGYLGRRRTNTARTDVEQRSDFNPNDSFYEHIIQARTITQELGQRRG